MDFGDTQSNREHILEILMNSKKENGGSLDEEIISRAADASGLSVREVTEIAGFYSMLSGDAQTENDYSPDPVSVKDYIEDGGMKALHYVDDLGTEGVVNAIKDAKLTGAEEVISSIKASGLKGRGGAAFPTGVKWDMVCSGKAEEKYIVCNADEGEFGAFKDRMVIEKMPFKMIEGIAVAAKVTGAHRGYIYLRGEYGMLLGFLRNAVDQFKPYFPPNFDLQVISGAGAYICGEETALLSSVEGGRGEPRMKPPFPTSEGLYGCPTLINNAETFADIPDVLCGRVPGKLVCMSGAINRPGVYCVELEKHSIRELIESDEFAGGIKDGKKAGFVQLGGYSGSILMPSQFGVSYGYDSLGAFGASIGSGVILVYDEEESVISHCADVLDFFIFESCGRCSVCRNGLPYVRSLLEKFEKGCAKPGDIEKLEAYTGHISNMAFCGLGKGAVTAVSDCLKYRRKDFEACVRDEDFHASAVFGRCAG